MKLISKAIAIAIATSASFGATATESSWQENLSTNGFGTIGATYMGGDERDFGKNGSIENGLSFYEDTKLGLQASYMATDNLTFTAQVRVKGFDNEFKADIPWLYAQYSVNPELSVRAGRMAIPAFLISDSMDVGYAQTTIRPASEMYEQVRVNNYEGAELIYNTTVLNQDIKLQVFGGRSSEKDSMLAGQPAKFKGENLIGFNSSLMFEYGHVRAGYVQVDADFNVTDAPIEFTDTPGDYISIGYQFEYNNWLTSAEWGKVVVDVSTGSTETTGFYLTNGYRIDQFTPYITFAKGNHDNFNASQQSVIIGSRWDFADSMALKAEYQHVSTDGYYGHFETKGLMGYAGPAFGFEQEGDADIFSVTLDFIF